MGKKTEYCGRCAMSSVIDFTDEETDDPDRSDRDPFGGDRIELDDAELRILSPSAWLGGVKQKMDDVATHLTYGR